MSLAERISEAIQHSGKSNAEIARKTGKSAAAVTQWLSGETKSIKGDTAAALESVTGYRAQWLVSGKGPKRVDSNVVAGPDIRGSVPLLSGVQAGAFKEILDSDYSGGDGVTMIPTTVPVNRYTFALRVQGDSMEPRFTEGMLLIVEPELDAQHGDYVIVKNGGEETTFKQLIRDGSDWFLKPLNPRYPIKPLGADTVVGVVRGVTEQFR